MEERETLKSLKDAVARLEGKQDSQSKLLVEIYAELKGGEFTIGAFEQVKKNTTDIDTHEKRLNDIEPTVKTLRKSVWALLAAAASGAVGFVWWVLQKLFVIKTVLKAGLAYWAMFCANHPCV